MDNTSATIAFEEFLYTGFYDGPTDGFLRSRALGALLAIGSEFVCGPALASWWHPSWHERAFIVEAVPDGTCDRIRKAHPVSAKGLREHGLVREVDHYKVPFASDLEAMWRGVSCLAHEFENEHWKPTKRGLAVIQFTEEWNGLLIQPRAG